MDRRPTEQPRPVPRAGRGRSPGHIESAARLTVIGRAARTAIAAERRARFNDLRRRGYTVHQAARVLGVTPRTGNRYESHRHQQAQQGAPRT